MSPPPVAHLISSSDRPEEALPGSHGWVRVLVDHRVGSRNLLQREFRFGPGRTPELHDDDRDEAMYVVEGLGTVDLGGASYELAPGTAVFVPAGASYVLETPGPHDVVLVSVLSKAPGTKTPTQTDRPGAGSTPTYVVREEDEPTLPAGDDRTFK